MFNDLGHGENPHTDFVCSFALCWIFFFFLIATISSYPTITSLD